MSILARGELITLFKTKVLGIEDPNKALDSWADSGYSYNNAFQQCSIDLHVGEIYVPETDPNSLGGKYNPKTDEHVLETGHTAMLRTKKGNTP